MGQDRPRLRFRDDGTFRVVQLTDVHWCDDGDKNARSLDLIESVLAAEQPDLVALTGDIVSGKECPDPGAAYLAAVSPMERRGIPWASVFGNHDDEGRLSRLDLLRAQLACGLCLTERGPLGLTGIGNYVLRIEDGDGRLAAALYFIDSGSYAPRGPGHYAWIARDQIAWYLDRSEALARDYGGEQPVPALAFFHIPLPEYAAVWEEGRCLGSRHEPVCGPELNSGFFAALVERGDVMGTFVGHDHANDYEGELHGVRLCYGRASGYGGYGREGFARGARVIQLESGARRFTTWIRLEDGTLLRR